MVTDLPATPGPSDQESFWRLLVEQHHYLPALLRLLAQHVVDLLGDGCVLTTVTPDGTELHPSAIVHRDPVVADAMHAVLSRPNTRIGEGIAGTVAADRRPIVMNDLEPQTITETTPARFLPFVRDHPIRSMLIVPLVAGGELVGTLGSLRTSSDAPYTPEDLSLMEALADRAAHAVADAMAGPRAIGVPDFEAIYRYNLDGVLITTPDGHVLAANPAACEILGRSEREIIHGGRDAIVVTEDPRLAPALAARAAAGRARTELTLRRDDGTTFEADVASTIYTTPDHKVRTVLIFRDMSDEVEARELAKARVVELEQVAERDPLTGLRNRRGFAMAAEHALASADRAGVVSQVVFVDLNGLKETNDRLGHAAGDAAIIALGRALERSIRESDVACRLGGDEFAALLVGTSADEVPSIVERIRHELACDQNVSGDIGFAAGSVERAPHSSERLDELVVQADQVMYQQKVVARLRSADGPT